MILQKGQLFWIIGYILMGETFKVSTVFLKHVFVGEAFVGKAFVTEKR